MTLNFMKTLLTFLIFTSFADAQNPPRLFFQSTQYESPSLVAPVSLLVLSPSPNSQWQLAVQGWTLATSLKKRMNSKWSFNYVLKLTPINSNGSNRIYEGKNGKELKRLLGEENSWNKRLDENSTYKNLTLHGITKLSYKHTTHWTSSLAVTGLYEKVEELDQDLQEYWKSPYIGLNVELSFRDLVSENLYTNQWEGLKAKANSRFFVGSESWGQLESFAGYGRNLKYIHTQTNIFLLYSWNTNLVNKFLIGGGWDLPGLHSLYGYPYGFFRLEKGLLINELVDIAIKGDWSLAFRFSALKTSNIFTYGQAFKIMKTWNGFYFNAGISFPEQALIEGQYHNFLILGGVSFASFYH